MAYHPVFNLIPQLYAENDFDLVLHIGVAAGRDYFAVEQSSSQSVNQNYGYQNSPDVDNKYFTVAEQTAAWADQPITIETDLDLPQVVELWQNKTSDIAFPPLNDAPSAAIDSTGAAIERRNARAGSLVEVKGMNDFDYAATLDQAATDDVRWSDEVGFYLCGFIYYTGLAEVGKTRARDLVFMHVPNLLSDEEIAMGVEVTTELINSLVESWREG